ncbi:hypothetical protein SDRG_03973 [Saprolegnia diclina VS20]|uniref:Transmembrane protein 198 n=1 Tax=Saprolegnia diclina (strain VS20) TaxID=1156394 RepID=T0QWI5_SAPDV|nr:hypothetical protein SDRG_03973 [Saprolegnia diclina VS20]EQC39021.1 hypothetical protein SDRG_03973 [Saprolegnia diclina VS20]|eukprot:XP_008607845.1 hypothetical protein SDRG_03973 [Saprolegnia diclina VS20]
MYVVASHPNEPLLGPASMRKPVLGPALPLLRPRTRRLVNVTLGVAMCIAFSVFLLGLFAPYTPPYATLLASSSASTASPHLIAVVAPAVVYGVATAVGLTLGLLGYRFVKLAFFLSGFAIGLVLGFNAAYVAFEHETYVFPAALGIGVLAAVILAVAALFFFRFGVAVLGVLAGVGLGAFVGALFLMRLYPAQPEVPIVIAMAIGGVAIGLVVYLQERLVVVLCTAFLGGYFFVLGVGNLIGSYPSPTSIVAFLDALKAGGSYAMPGAWWAYFGATLVAWIGFGVIQFQYTAPVHETPAPASPPRSPAAVDGDYTAVTSPKGSAPPFRVERGL